MIHFPPVPTYHPPNNRTPSTIDLIIDHTGYDISEPETHPSDSDHDMVTFSITLNDAVSTQNEPLIPCFSKTNWDIFQEIIETVLESAGNMSINDVETEQQVDDHITQLTATVTRDQHAAVPLVTRHRYAITLTPDILSLIRHRNALIRARQRNSYLRNQLSAQLNFYTGEIRSKIQELRNKNFNEMIENIPVNDQNRSLWRVTKFNKKRGKRLRLVT